MTVEELKVLLTRVLQDKAFSRTSTEPPPATFDVLKSEVQILRDRALAIEVRDRLINDIRKALR